MLLPILFQPFCRKLENINYHLNVAHQFIKQLQENIKDAVFGNVGNMAVFRVGADDAEYLEKQFARHLQPKIL
jgi:hypothetical protein